ncbi:MAG: esterase family protein [Lentisphaeria bacterium]|nr:esterase family protein [Lentisphaeria bacterium]
MCSASLEKQTNINIVHPSYWNGKDPLPVLYLLHGLSDDYSNWMRRSLIELFADEKNIMVVMPDGARSWYSNQIDGCNYYDYVSKELPEFIERTFNVAKTADKRFIAGLSMGGYGAVKIALRNPERYGAVAAFSGAYELNWVKEAHPKCYTEAFGDAPSAEDDVYRLVADFKSAVRPRFYLACGLRDRFYQCDCDLRDRLKAAGFDVVWDEEDRDHEWRFWNSQIEKAIPWMLMK